MATSAVGTLKEFNPDAGQDVAAYLEQIESFFKANNIAEEEKAGIFLTAVGPKTYETLRQHCTPNLLKDISYKDIVALFEQQYASNTSQHLSHDQAKVDKPAQDPESQPETNKLSKDSTQSQTQGKDGKGWKNTIGNVITDIRRKQKQRSQNPQDDQPSDMWELSLTDQEYELKVLQELGLGVAINITAKHPWVTKSAFQAKPVTREELIVINESNRSLKSKEHVETYTSIQQGLESSFRPDPTTPINITVAADFHRSSTRSKTIDSKTVLTRTIAFCAKDPFSRNRDEENKEDFEKNLHEWLVRKKCYPVTCAIHTSKGCGLYSETTNHHCIDYLKELGGVTHYVSSITLGATKYQVTLNSTYFNSLSASSEVSAHNFTLASTKTKASRKVFQSQCKEQHIGKIPDGKDDAIPFRTRGEAVVKCSYNSLANLVSHPQLREFLECGISEYIDLKKNGTRGPYHICTAEFLDSNNSEDQHRKRLYWMIDWKSFISGISSSDPDNNQSTEKCTLGRYRIRCTADEGKASNFYLKPTVQHASEKCFWIVTDPEDHEDRETKVEPEAESQEEEGYDKSEFKSQRQPPSDKCKPQSKNDEPQRYVSVYKKDLVVELIINPRSAKNSAFELKDPRDDHTYPLHKSQWLPEALRGSQPYIICCKGKSFRSRLKKDRVCSVYIEQTELERMITFGKHKEGVNGYGFFILESGHKT